MIKSITLEIEAATHINDAAYMAWRLSVDYKCPVRFGFNGIACEAEIAEDYMHVVNRYHEAMSKRGSGA